MITKSALEAEWARLKTNDYRSEDGWLTTMDIAKIWNITHSGAMDRLRRLVNEGKVEKAKGHRGYCYYRFKKTK